MTGFVYAITAGDLVKIGWSKDPLLRLNKIRSDCPDQAQLVGVVPATRAQELEAHAQLSRWRVRGEWFRHEGVVAAFVAMLPEPKPRASIGARFKHEHPLCRYRKGLGLTLKDVAATIGVSHATLSRIESGAQGGGRKLLKRISAATGIPVGDLVEAAQ
jgi:DNA-binding XRE family transcriptional regulator